MNIFEHRETIQPYEYPHLLKFVKAIHSAFWEVDHFTYTRDVRDFKVELTPFEKQVVERSMLAIGVVENKVKTFWARIDQRMPKTEISDVGHTFAGNEVIHRQAYERLLNELGLEKKFAHIFDVPCMDGRTQYLQKYLKGLKSRSNLEFTKSLILFTLMIENCSLFSQFLIISSFSKYGNVLKNFSKVINATAREEILHGKFGAELINIIRKENPEWFDEEMENKIRRNIRKAYKAELEVLNWIFEGGDLEWMTRDEVDEFLKHRFNDSLNQIGYENEYEIDETKLQKSDYLERMLLATKDFDFFDGKSTDYNLDNSFEEDNLWD
jgi:ribonucleoside-diphosphate reductase beta chain